MKAFRASVFFLLMHFAAGEAGADLTLENYLSQVEAANPSHRAALARSQALFHRISPSGTWQDPFVAVGVDEKPFSGDDATSVRRYQISQSIPFPGKLSAQQKSAESRAASAKSDAETHRRELVVLGTQVFYRTYYSHLALEANERIRGLVQNTMASTKSRYKTGEAGHHDWLLAKVELSILEVEKLRLQREQKTLRSVFNELRNEAPSRELGALKVDFTESTISSDSEHEMIRNQPELASYGALVSAAEQNQRLARLSYYPDFVVQGMMMEPTGMASSSEMRSSWGVMVGMSIPLFFFRKQSELSAAANQEREAAVFEKQNLENRVRSEIVDAKEQLRTAQDTVRLYRESVIPATQLAFSNAKTGYAARRLPLSQLLETARAQRTQELELVASQIDVEFAKTRLREVLSSPPVLRLAPIRPTVFGQGNMGAGSMPQGMSDTVNMGAGLSGPSRKMGGPKSGDSSEGQKGMEGM